MLDLVQTLEKYGGDRASLQLFEQDGPDLLPYAALLARRAAGDDDLQAVIGVYEWQRSPLAFLLDGDALEGVPHRLDRLRRILAMRGDAPYMAVVRPGALTLYCLGLDNLPAAKSELAVEGECSNTFAIVGNERPGMQANRRRYIADVVLALLTDAIDSLKNRHGLEGEQAISLVGRALFTRFLADRGLLPSFLAGQAPTLFDTPEAATATCQWLDETFNGDLLPLSDNLISDLSPAAFAVLGNIMRRAQGGQLALGWEERWDYLDFSYIPVGVLSQAYEHYMRTHAPKKQSKEGGFYTPLPIADLMVRGAFHSLRCEGRASSARILDPAAGAGVFLLTAFRQLVAERWREGGARPDTSTLRALLYDQVRGFDINEAALRFAALGLYLISIELDPDPEPVSKLKFERDLRGSVLHRVAKGERSLGSLGPEVGQEHVGQYDLVVGNPPWPTGTKLPGWAEVKRAVARIASERLGKRVSPPLPNEALDLPFLWRAMEWARPDGQIAFALHARLLFQHGDGMLEARQAVFAALDVTGIVNGSEVRQTSVWPGIDAPFCLLFARNRRPGPASGFRYVTPHTEPKLNAAGGWRIDPANAEILLSSSVQQHAEIMKVFARGTGLDWDVYERLRARELLTIKDYWTSASGLVSGNGYQKLRDSSPVDVDGKRGQSAAQLRSLREVNRTAMSQCIIDVNELPLFNEERLHRVRSRAIYSGPMLLVHQSPPANGGRIKSSVSDKDVAFRETYYSYSASQHPNGEALVRYLALIVGSKPALWVTLMTSGKFGFEREVIEKSTIDAIPIVPFEDLTDAQKTKARELFETIAAMETEESWAAVDEWVAGLYGLRPRDIQVIGDTLRYSLPFAANRKAAEKPVDRECLASFCAVLEAELRPWAKRLNRELSVTPVFPRGTFPWQAVRIVGSQNLNETSYFDSASPILKLADALAATELTEHDAVADTLWLARLNQTRYWTSSQARLVAQRVVWEHSAFLKGERK